MGPEAVTTTTCGSGMLADAGPGEHVAMKEAFAAAMEPVEE